MKLFFSFLRELREAKVQESLAWNSKHQLKSYAKSTSTVLVQQPPSARTVTDYTSANQEVQSLSLQKRMKHSAPPKAQPETVCKWVPLKNGPTAAADQASRYPAATDAAQPSAGASSSADPVDAAFEEFTTAGPRDDIPGERSNLTFGPHQGPEEFVRQQTSQSRRGKSSLRSATPGPDSQEDSRRASVEAWSPHKEGEPGADWFDVYDRCADDAANLLEFPKYGGQVRAILRTAKEVHKMQRFLYKKAAGESFDIRDALSKS